MRTIEQIVAEVSAWGDATFPNTSVVDLLRKLDEEYHELEEAAWLYLKLRGRVDLDSLAVFRIELLDEIADNFIVLARLTKALDADFRQVIEDKWDVVKARDYSEPKTASCELLNDAIAKKEAATQVAGGPLNEVRAPKIASRELLDDVIGKIASSDRSHLALRNIRALANKIKRAPGSLTIEEVADHLLRFAKEGGVKDSILRGAE